MNNEENQTTETKDLKIDNLTSEIGQLEQQMVALKQQAAFHLLERDLHDEAYKGLRQQLNQAGALVQAKQIELQALFSERRVSKP